MKIFRSVIWMGFIFTALWTFTSLEKVKADNTKYFCSGQVGGKIPICANGNTDDCCPPGPYLDSCSCIYCSYWYAHDYIACTCLPSDGAAKCVYNQFDAWQLEQGYDCSGVDVINNKGTLYCGSKPAGSTSPMSNCNPPTCAIINAIKKKPPPQSKIDNQNDEKNK